ncbi:MAG: hypothetical protein Q9181_000761 [Wetmoreana brouardii]
MPAASLPNKEDSDDSKDDLGEFTLIDDLFKARAKDKVQKPLLAFPTSERGASDFEFFTGKDLDRFVEHAARYYLNGGLKVNKHMRAAVLGPTNIEWVATFFGLVRAGFAVVTLSPRISATAIVNLTSETQCETVIYADSPQLRKVVDQVKEQKDVQTMTMLQRAGFDKPPTGEPPLERDIDKAKEIERNVVIMHSSGSTGLPKPIYTPHKRYTQSRHVPGPGTRELITLPLYHAFPMSIVPYKMYIRKTTYFLDANLPLTHDTVTKALKGAQPAAVYAVPYVLKLLGEQSEGIDVLRSCEQVVTTGSQCPEELGDRLVHAGVKLGIWLGSTEVGPVGTSLNREPGDNDWAYLRVPPPYMEHIWPRPISDNQFEFVFLKDYPFRVESNSNDPPSSYYSKDIFSPHPKMHNAWKYIGRLDDRVNLINGEKVLPLPIEGRIKENPLVKEAVVFGIARPIPGLLAFRAEAAKAMTDEEFIEKIMPDVEAANRTAEGFSQIGRDMIIPLPAGIEYPQTDKGSIIRAQMYRVYEKEINDVYGRLDLQEEGSLKLDVPELEEHLLTVGRQLIGEQLEDKTTDFFSAGMDSLRAIRMRGILVRDLDLGGNSKDLSQNIVFETSNVENLAKYLYNLGQGQTTEVKDWKIVAKGLVQKQSLFQKHIPGSKAFPDQHIVVLTGATGGLGSHLLSKLSSSPSVSQIYCLTRGRDPLARLRTSLHDRKFSFQPSKTIALTSDFSQPTLGLSEATYSEIQSSATHIIHAAWPVNFQLPLSSFEPHIQGLHNLLQLSLSSPYATPAKFVFCSSVSTALGTPSPARIPEQVIESLDQASDMGYGQSKLVGEHIVAAAVQQAGAKASILRIGQVVGDTKEGMWNDREAFPLIVRSALTMGVLPELGIKCEWLPVDTLAGVVGELAGLQMDNIASGKSNGITDAPAGDVKGEKMELVYNIRSPHTFPWTASFLPALRSAGLDFQTIPVEEWVKRLRLLSSQPSSANPAADPDQNPALKLLQYYESSFTGRDEEKDGRIEFEIEKAKRDSRALRDAPDVVASGLVEKMVRWWMSRWVGGQEKEIDGAGVEEGDDGDAKNGKLETLKQQEGYNGAVEEINKGKEEEDLAGERPDERNGKHAAIWKQKMKEEIKAELKAELMSEIMAALGK